MNVFYTELLFMNKSLDTRQKEEGGDLELCRVKTVLSYFRLKRTIKIEKLRTGKIDRQNSLR